MFVLRTLAILIVVVAVNCDENLRVKRAKYSYPTRFYKKPPPPHVIKGPFSYTPPPNYMRDDEPSYRSKVSKKPTNDGLADEDISNLIKHLTKKDLDKIMEFAGENDRYSGKVDSREKFNYKPELRRPERNTGYRNDDIEQFAQNIHHFKESDETNHYNVEYKDQMNFAAGKPRILHPTPPTFSEDFGVNLNLNYINEALQSKEIYSNQPENHNPKITYSSHQEPQFSTPPGYPKFPFQNPNLYQQEFTNNIPSSNSIFNANSQTHIDTEESMHQYNYISYVTVPPNYNEDKGSIFTDSDTMKEEQLPRPLNLREDDIEGQYTDNKPKVVKPDGYSVESFKDLPLMNFDSKLHTVSSYNVPHYLVTATKSQQQNKPPQLKPSSSVKPVQIERAPPGYTGKEMSDAHLKAIKIWTHRSKGTAYTLHDDGTLSLEKPKIRTSYGYTP